MTAQPASSPVGSDWPTVLPVGHDLDRAALRDLVTRIGRKPEEWQHLVRHDSERRHCVQLHRDPHLDIWLLCWSHEQETGLHDHDLSSGAVYVCRGELVEDRLEQRDGHLERVSVSRAEGEAFDFDSSHVHCIRHPEESAPAVSIHVYSPALWRMGYYDVGADGLLRRLSVSYAEELTAA